MTNVTAPTKADSAEVETTPSPHLDHNVGPRQRTIESLPDHRILSELLSLNRQQLRFEAELLLFLGELDRRQLYRGQAVPSAFDYCVRRLGYSEDVAYKRVGVARLLRRFPAIYAWRADGRVHLSALLLLKPHLNEENCEAWLHVARGKSKRQIKQLIAARCPQADVPTTVRKLPSLTAMNVTVTTSPPTRAAASVTTSPPTSTAASVTTSPSSEGSSHDSPGTPPSNSHSELIRTSVGHVVSKTASRTQVAPLSSTTYRITFTANSRLKQKLDRAGELLSHCMDPKDLPALVERALDELLEREEKRRYGTGGPVPQEASQDLLSMGSREQDPDPKDAGPLSPLRVKQGQSTSRTQEHLPVSPAKVQGRRRRWIPLAVRRAVFERDAGQCTYVDARRNRCEARHRLELDNIDAHAIGGPDSVANIRLRCKSHNQLAAEQLFGRGHVKRAMKRPKVVS